MTNRDQTILGYATRSRSSALVMKAVDLWPFPRRQRPFEWKGPCFIASLAGLGDLFIELPLLDALVEEAIRRGLEVEVLLRRQHAPLGVHLGWPVRPFENVIQEIFNGRLKAAHLSDLGASVSWLRKRRFQLGIDLTGNSLNALLMALGGVGGLASKTTRGGRKLIRYPLPNDPWENEYTYQNRLAEFFGVRTSGSTGEKLRAALPPPKVSPPYTLLCLTTPCQWRNWPVGRYLEVVKAFPRRRFVLTGLPMETLPSEGEALTELRSQPNIVDHMGTTGMEEFVSLVGSASAVLTNDTSAAHAANLFAIPGVVIFGPSDPATWAAPWGVRVLHDDSCPFFPCTQWHCERPEAWCMEKISVQSVIAALESLPGQ